MPKEVTLWGLGLRRCTPHNICALLLFYTFLWWLHWDVAEHGKSQNSALTLQTKAVLHGGLEYGLTARIPTWRSLNKQPTPWMPPFKEVLKHPIPRSQMS